MRRLQITDEVWLEVQIVRARQAKRDAQKGIRQIFEIRRAVDVAIEAEVCAAFGDAAFHRKAGSAGSR